MHVCPPIPTRVCGQLGCILASTQLLGDSVPGDSQCELGFAIIFSSVRVRGSCWQTCIRVAMVRGARRQGHEQLCMHTGWTGVSERWAASPHARVGAVPRWLRRTSFRIHPCQVPTRSTQATRLRLRQCETQYGSSWASPSWPPSLADDASRHLATGASSSQSGSESGLPGSSIAQAGTQLGSGQSVMHDQ